jgi:hypothetical protein
VSDATGPSGSDAAKRGSVLAHQEKRASRVDVTNVAIFERNLPHGRGDGSKNASFKIREASWARAHNSPVPGEGRSPNSPADEERS